MSEIHGRVDVTKFYTFDELTGILNGWVEQFPGLASLESIGKSYEGRDLWVLTVTNQKTGPADEKPALYNDANIHAGEVTGCSVVLYTIDELLHGYSNDDAITHLLDTMAFYFLPRQQPDGVELYLTSPYTLRSSVRRWPFEEDDDGLTPEDINGDGKILQMRVPDPKGEWRISDQDDRLMVKREPDEIDGEYYRIYTEGILNDYVRGPVKLARPKYGLDQNRNWPGDWSVHQRGGGPYPLSEPETAAVTKFLSDHRNINIIQAYHTTGGVILRPSATQPDSSLLPRDLEIYQDIGKIGEELTGYPCASVHTSFPLQDDARRRSQSGSFMDVTYDLFGMWTFATELWDLQSRAGIERNDNDPMRVVREQTEEDGLKILAFVDEQLGGRGVTPWQAFNHPQLGAVEVGGWENKYLRQNAPPEFLVDEAERNAAFTLRKAGMLPLLAIGDTEVEPVGDDLYIVRAMIENTGYLPTYSSQKAMQNNVVLPVNVEIDGAEVLMGKAKQEIGHLQGRSANRGRMMAFGQAKVENERLVEWLVRGTGEVTITASSEKAGVRRKELALQ